MGISDCGYITVVFGAMFCGLLLGIFIKKIVTRFSLVRTAIVRLRKRKPSSVQHLGMIGDRGDYIEPSEASEIEPDTLELDASPNLKSALALTEFDDTPPADPYYPKGKDEIFSRQRRNALEESCMKLETTIYFLLAIILSSHLIVEKNDVVEMSTWQIFKNTISYTWLTFLDYGRAWMHKLANLTNIDGY